ncbi:helix-turn-helix domain-containing protein [Kribbella monticola]|uniref:helix-turn-helix domain-containing protein n=1 Tax=Kribbella monticola TaxID=2185285 RepID=UPI001300779C|nr:AraC family transcriptional regulator [Kribbella monticola]
MLTLDGYLLARRAQFSLAVDSYDTWCLLLPRTGAFAYEVSGGNSGVARFGDLVICPPGGTLRRRMLRPTSFFHARFSTQLEPPVGCTRLPDPDRLRADLAMLDSAEGYADVVAAHVVTDLILLMLRAHRAAPGDELVRRATAYLLEYFASPDLSLADLATTLGISPGQLSRRFKAVQGISPIAYLRNLRLQKARELLTETDATLQTIAERSGYRSAFYLSRVFTHHTGHPPSHHRNVNRV